MSLNNLVKDKRVVGLLIIVLLGAGVVYPFWMGVIPIRAQELSPTPVPSAPATVTANPVVTSPPTFNNEIQPPLCQNIPFDLAAWRSFISEQLLDNPGAAIELSQALAQTQALTPIFRDLDLQTLLQALNVADTTGSEALVLRELLVLWLNVMSGRLNRATELKIETQPDIQTVDDLLVKLGQALGEPALAAPLVEISQKLQIGQNISRHVCGRLAYRVGPALYERIWAENGYSQNDTLLLDVPAGVTSFSPDYTKLIIETPLSDSGGGPLFLFDLKTKTLVNLSEQFDFLDYQGLLGLTVVGWHPDGQHFLLFDQDNDVVLWVHLNDYSYQRISLGAEMAGMAPVRQVALRPDGSALIYVTDGPERGAVLNEYSLIDQNSRRLLTLDTGGGRLDAFRISPDGDKAAYVLRHGKRSLGLTYELVHLDLTESLTSSLVEESLVPAEPVWSPDGQKLAFLRKKRAEPAAAGSGQRPNPGNIWLATPATGEIQQLTFGEEISYPPIWATDSRFLAFISQSGEVGLVSIEQPGKIWSMGAILTQPEFSSIAFIP